MNYKAALAIQGGGIRGVYASGAIDYLMEKQIEFEYVIGTSAGALNGVDYLSGDIGRTRDIMLNFMKDPKFVSFSNAILKGSFFDFNYLMHVIPKSLPFNQKQFDESNKTFYCCATCLESGKPAYFEHKMPNFLLKGVAASSSLPIVTPKPVAIGGKHYLDGGTTESLPFHKPFEDGYQKVVVIATRPKGYRKAPLKATRLALVDFLYQKYPEYCKADKKWVETYNAHMDELDALADSKKAFVLYPSVPIHVKSAEKNVKKIQHVYDLGYNDMKACFNELLEYLEEHHE